MRPQTPLPTRQHNIKFGTDGWRAVMGKDFSFSNVELVAQAYADYINATETGTDAQNLSLPNDGAAGDLTDNSSAESPVIVVGFDRRLQSNEFARRVAEVLAGNNLKVALFEDAVPTPLVSWTVCKKNAGGGVVITASHNPAEFNGFKIKAAWGGSASSDCTRAVESLIGNSPVRRNSLTDSGMSVPSRLISEAAESYRTQLSSYVDLDRICSAQATIIIDPMHGAGGRWVESFLKKRGKLWWSNLTGHETLCKMR